jgi:acetylornithine deacetylase/succinyl-diaminopimelate desuccinylase-like protein
MGSWENYLQERRPQYLEELLEFLRIPSISSLPEHKDDVQQAAQWVSARLQRAGMEDVQVLATGGHPVVFGQWLHAEGKPTILIYGHFDTQPVDPLDLWTHPPFEPVVKENRVYARGAADDKGNMLIPILAVEAMLNSQETLPVNVKFFFEGQEEIGSPQLPEFIAAHRDLLSCDFILSADGGQWGDDQPLLILGLRGLGAIQIDVQSARSDVHSGTYGGMFLNPIHALANLLDSMHSADGKISVGGFYDDVRSVTDIERSHIAAVPYSDAEFKNELGVEEVFGEPGFSTYERGWIRPTLDVNGIWGGFQGEGIKTVIPSTAHAKISCRLVPDQQPAKIIKLLKAHVDKHAPKGVRVSVSEIPGTADPYVIPLDHPGNQAAQAVHKELFGKAPYFVRMGGSIPVCSMFLSALDAYTVNFAFGLQDENVHAPDEFFRLSSFERGQKAYCMMLERLGNEK